MSQHRLHQQFVDRFNAGDLAGLTGLLAKDATAEVLGAGFPVERDADVIAHTSFPHILGERDSVDEPLSALLGNDLAGAPLVLLVRDDALDTAIRIDADDSGARIARIEYLVGWQRPDELRAIATTAGLRFSDPHES